MAQLFINYHMSCHSIGMQKKTPFNNAAFKRRQKIKKIRFTTNLQKRIREEKFELVIFAEPQKFNFILLFMLY